MKKVIHLTSTIFTVLMLTFAVLSYLDMAPEVTNVIAIQGFIMSISVAVVMVISEKMENRINHFHFAGTVIFKIFICYFVVFFEGILFDMCELSWKGLLEITPALIPIFLITSIVQYFTNIEWADTINESIRRKK